VLTQQDVPGVNDAGIKHDEPLFPDEVRYHGHAVCWVLGETLEAARRGALEVEVAYEPLPAILTVVEAIDAESYQGMQPVLARGDVAAGIARAAHVFEGEIDFAGQEHFYLETHCALAMVDENGQVFVQSSTQHPTETQEITAHVLGLPSNRVTVQCLRMGGGFGGKEMQPHGLAAVAALGATLTGRPVRLRLTRQQDMTMTGKRHGFHATWRVGFDDDGRFTALEATLTSDGGWSLDLSEPVLARAICHVDNAYWIPDVRIHGPRDLGQRQPFVLGEDHDFALQRPQGLHGPADDVAKLAALVIDRLGHKGLVVERLQPVFLSPAFQRQVPGNPQQEGAQRPAVRIEPVRMPQQADERILGNVLRRGRRTGHAPGKPVDGVLVLGEGGLELGVRHVAR